MSNVLSRPLRKRKEVMLLNPEDYRYTTLQVERETESVIYCKKHDGIVYRFFKLGPGWTGDKTRFLAVEGTPLVSYINEEEAYAETPLDHYLQMIWGEKGWDGLPDVLKQKVHDTKTGTTVTVEPIIPDEDTQKKFDELKAEGVLYDADLDSLAKFAKATVKKNWRDDAFKALWILLAGVGLDRILIGLGILS